MACPSPSYLSLTARSLLSFPQFGRRVVSVLSTFGAHPDESGRLGEIRYLWLLLAATVVSIVLAYLAVRIWDKPAPIAAALAAFGACGATTLVYGTIVTADATKLVGPWLVVAAFPFAFFWFLIAADDA